jgi:site-specific DNA-adenine methylase
MTLNAPFPYFGAKSKVAHLVWSGLGNVKHYIEPFFGSGAVLLGRPGYTQSHLETVCDADGFIANVWRSIQFDPDEVARYCDWPVNHADLMARRKVLIKNEDRLLENLTSDPEWFDAKLAGYWVWAASCWIGRGLTFIGARPHIGDGGIGIHKAGQRPHIGGGKGVHKAGQIPDLTFGGMGVHKTSKSKRDQIYGWMDELSNRLRNVRVVCGDWTRVCGGDWQDKMGICGMFFDPPYSAEGRDNNLYHKENLTVADDVRKWCVERGDKKSYRIVLAGYDEHDDLESHGWRSVSWKATGGYANQGGKSADRDNQNRHREQLWFSPHCIESQLNLF